MSPQRHDGELLGAYVLGVLDEREERAVESHVRVCQECRDEVAVLREWEARLGEVPPEAFLDGPPDGGDLLLHRTLGRAREERRSAEWRQRLALAAVAVVATAAVLGGGYAVGRTTGGPPPAARPTVTVSPTAAPQPAGTVVTSAKDPRTGARLVVRMTPAADWVRLNAAVSGVPAGERCLLVVVARNGERVVAGSWLVGSAEKGANLDGSAAVARDDVAEIVVESASGKRYVAASMTYETDVPS
ncbi:anti-sigma factor family protein [Streptomyces sp. NPDC014894]|uniref:anti-sigma factor family protein n=1 Tax=unclassified Streptomyces TaxID=2593676 RepID=UPI0036FC195F